MHPNLGKLGDGNHGCERRVRRLVHCWGCWQEQPVSESLESATIMLDKLQEVKEVSVEQCSESDALSERCWSTCTTVVDTLLKSNQDLWWSGSRFLDVVSGTLSLETVPMQMSRMMQEDTEHKPMFMTLFFTFQWISLRRVFVKVGGTWHVWIVIEENLWSLKNSGEFCSNRHGHVAEHSIRDPRFMQTRWGRHHIVLPRRRFHDSCGGRRHGACACAKCGSATSRGLRWKTFESPRGKSSLEWQADARRVQIATEMLEVSAKFIESQMKRGRCQQGKRHARRAREEPLSCVESCMWRKTNHKSGTLSRRWQAASLTSTPRRGRWRCGMDGTRWENREWARGSWFSVSEDETIGNGVFSRISIQTCDEGSVGVLFDCAWY